MQAFLAPSRCGHGCIAVDLVPLEASHRALIGAPNRERFGPLMNVIDACNRRFGRGAVVPARTGIIQMRSPRYTTQVGELPAAVA